MRHPKQSPQLEHDDSYWGVEIKHTRKSQWALHPLSKAEAEAECAPAWIDGLKWIAVHRKRARQVARDLRGTRKYFAVRAIKLQRITRA